MKVPETNSIVDLQDAFRSVWEELDGLFKKNINLHGNKFINVGESSAPSEFLSRREFNTKISTSTTTTVNSPSVKVTNSTLSPGRVTITDQIYYETDTGELKVNTGDAVVTIGGRMAKLEDDGSTQEVFSLIHTTTGTAAAGFGAEISFYLEDGSGATAEKAGVVGVEWTDATAGSEDADFVLKLKRSGVSPAEMVRITSDKRFLADFDATNSGFQFMNETTGTTYLSVLSNGGTESGVIVNNGADAGNAGRIVITCDSTAANINSTHSGSGTALDLIFSVHDTEVFRIDSATKNLLVASGKVIKVGGDQVIGAQGAAVADASGGTTIDAEARTAINTLLARLRVHGLIDT
jgi:hypothetical protein